MNGRKVETFERLIVIGFRPFGPTGAILGHALCMSENENYAQARMAAGRFWHQIAFCGLVPKYCPTILAPKPRTRNFVPILTLRSAVQERVRIVKPGGTNDAGKK